LSADSVPPPSHLTCTPTKSNLYFQISSTTALSEPAIYILLTFQVQNLISIFFRLGHLSNESIQVWGFLNIFVIAYYSQWGVASPTRNPQAGGPPLVGSQRLLIQYIRSCSPYLEGVSSIHNLMTQHSLVTWDSPNMGFSTCTAHYSVTNAINVLPSSS
jgi:hypothetical protein